MNHLLGDIENHFPHGVLLSYGIREYIQIENDISSSFIQISNHTLKINHKGKYVKDSWNSFKKYNETDGVISYMIQLEIDKKYNKEDVETFVVFLKDKYSLIDKIIFI